MSARTLSEIIPVLQVAIGPVILISGVGMLLLVMTNRLGRAIDRARLLAGDLKSKPGAENDHREEQLGIIYRRAKMLRLSIALASLSVLLAAFLIIILFISALRQWSDAILISLTFIACLLSLVASLIAFLYDVHLSLVALKLELQQARSRSVAK